MRSRVCDGTLEEHVVAPGRATKAACGHLRWSQELRHVKDEASGTGSPGSHHLAIHRPIGCMIHTPAKTADVNMPRLIALEAL